MENINQKLIDYLRELNVCIICQLRYLKARGKEYDVPAVTFAKHNVTFPNTEEVEDLNNKESNVDKGPSADEKINLRESVIAYDSDENQKAINSLEPDRKKIKLILESHSLEEISDINNILKNEAITNDKKKKSVVSEEKRETLKTKICTEISLASEPKCPQCLGLFSQSVQNKLIESITNANINKYDYEGIVIAITTPVVLHIRQLSMWYALLKKFPEKFNKNKSPDVPIKEAAKLILNPIICEKLNKKYDSNGVSINLELKHISEDSTLEQFKKMHDFRTKNLIWHQRKVVISRTLIESQYNPSTVDSETYEKYFQIPPTMTESSLYLERVELIGPTVYVAGRYRKYSRNLSHTPWILNGKRIKEDSIEEILINNIAPHFYEGNSKVIFMSSGREDVDVRCLGRGRPFLLEIPNALHSNLTQQQAHTMEQVIDKSKKVSARNLQIVPKEEQVFIKTGEQHKKKNYRALCRLKERVSSAMIKKLNSYPEFVIQQKTPLRVLHRRPLLTRPRTIYSMKAYVDPKHYDILILDIVTQAGTYIKELVHGEFGRTEPSIATILDKKIDIIALDVIDIEMDWPKSIDNSILIDNVGLQKEDCVQVSLTDEEVACTSAQAKARAKRNFTTSTNAG